MEKLEKPKEGYVAPVLGPENDVEKLSKKYSNFAKTHILKLDMLRRGIAYTATAAKEVTPKDEYDSTLSEAPLLFSLSAVEDTFSVRVPYNVFLLDGTSIGFRLTPPDKKPYAMDYKDGKFLLADPLRDNQVVAEDVMFPLSPHYYGKKTSDGVPMEKVASVKGNDCLFLIPNRYCQFFTKGEQCKYCDIVPDLQRCLRHDPSYVAKATPQQCYEVVKEAIKQKGKWRAIYISGGTDFGGSYTFENEFKFYLEVCKAVQRAFNAPKWIGVLNASPFREEDMIKIRETGCSDYQGSMEVWDRKGFANICPGKERVLGWDGYRTRIAGATKAFGEGQVYVVFVVGAEVNELGVPDWHEAVKRMLEGIEWFATRGVVTYLNYLVVEPGSGLFKMGVIKPPLEYYVQVTNGLRDILEKYGLRQDSAISPSSSSHVLTEMSHALDYHWGERS